MDDRISIRIILKSSQVTEDTVSQWFRNMTYFVPSKMRGTVLTNNKSRKYDTKKFYDGIYKELNLADIVAISVEDDDNSFSLIKGAYCQEITWLSFGLSSDVFQKNKINIINYIDNIMMKYDGIFASACSLEDEFWQDNEDIDYYHIKGKSLLGINTKKDDLFPDDVIVDTEYNPGHSHIVNGIWFGSCWMMWYGKEYFKYIPIEVLENFTNCFENKVCSKDFVRITLYESPWEYDKKENRDRQWEFRKSVGVDELANILANNNSTSHDTDSAIEISEGNFEHGGIRLIKYYYSDKRELIGKSQATEVRVHELGEDGQLLWSETIAISV